MSAVRRGAMLLAAAVALVLAGLLVLVSVDARGWRDTVRDDDVRFQVAPRRAQWQADERAPFGLAHELLAVDDDVRLRRAYRFFQLARSTAVGFEAERQRAAARTRAHVALTELMRVERDRARRSVVANLLALLTFDQAINDQRSSRILMQRSIAELRRAIRLNPQNEEAKFNLEMVLRLSDPDARQERERIGIFGSGEGVGAGASAPGRGY